MKEKFITPAMFSTDRAIKLASTEKFISLTFMLTAGRSLRNQILSQEEGPSEHSRLNGAKWR